MTVNSLKSRKNFRRTLHVLATGSGLTVILSFMFFSLFHIFEHITYDSISDLNREFAIQIDTLTESINSSIVNYGMQLFYSNSVKSLMGRDNFSNTERVYMTRDLNTSLSSTDFAESILICNRCSGIVYSTDPGYPQQSVNDLKSFSLQNLLLNSDPSQRFKPIFCRDEDSGQEYYAFLFYELYSDKTPKPGRLIITVKSKWYKKALLAANPSSDLIVLDPNEAILVSASQVLEEKYPEYVSQISPEENSGYILNNKKKEICMYYRSPSTGHTYMRISSHSKLLPRLLYFRKSAICMFLVLLAFFLAALAVLLVFALIPMLHMKEAIKTIDHIQTGTGPDALPPASIPLREQIEAVVSRSERARLERAFYDLLTSGAVPGRKEFFGEKSGTLGLLLVQACHRKDIYAITEKVHPELITAKFSHAYACIALYASEDAYQQLYKGITSVLECRCFVSPLFDSFEDVKKHFAKLDELRKLSLVLPDEERIILEETLNGKADSNQITTKDFTDLIVRLKSGSLESSRIKWKEIMDEIANYGYDEFQYVLYRAQDTVCTILKELPPSCESRNENLLPESLEEIQSVKEISDSFDRAFVTICGCYDEKKAEKYSNLADQIKEMVQKNYFDIGLSSQSIADQIHMNTAYLGRLFKSSYGSSINEYINTCRIKEGMRLLRETDFPVEDIAQTVGFSNIKYFYVLFKKHAGTTPTQYRNFRGK